MGLYDGCIYYWNCNGDVNDSVGSNDGILEADGTYTAEGQGITPQGGGAYSGKAINLGTTGYILTSETSILGTDERSISLWFLCSNVNQNAPLAIKVSSSNGYAQINIGIANDWNSTAGKHLYFYEYAEGVSPIRGVVTTATYTDGLWHHVVAVRATTYSRLYVDGSLIVENVMGIPNILNDTFWRLGGGWGGQFLVGGFIDEIGIWDRVLSPTEVADLYLLSSVTYHLSANESLGLVDLLHRTVKKDLSNATRWHYWDELLHEWKDCEKP